MLIKFSFFLRLKPPQMETRRTMRISMRFQRRRDMSLTFRSIYEQSMVSSVRHTPARQDTCTNSEVKLQKKTCCSPDPLRFTHTLQRPGPQQLVRSGEVLLTRVYLHKSSQRAENSPETQALWSVVLLMGSTSCWSV